jgi:hypothetical protein
MAGAQDFLDHKIDEYIDAHLDEIVFEHKERVKVIPAEIESEKKAGVEE